MKLRVLIFDNDPSILSLLHTYLTGEGHQVLTYAGPYDCPLSALDACACPAEQRCADAVLVDVRFPTVDGIAFLVERARKGCKLVNANKAVMSATLNEAQERTIRELGFSTLKKPFRLSLLSSWLRDCQRNLEASP